MTTIVAVKKNEEIVIGADTKVSMGENFALNGNEIRGNSKIIEIENIIVAMAGPPSHLKAFSLFVGAQGVLRSHKLLDIFQYFNCFHAYIKQEFHFREYYENDDDSYESTDVDILLAAGEGIFSISSSRNVIEYENFMACGTGRDFALGAMHCLHSKCNAYETAKRGLEAAAAYDVNTGAPIEIVKRDC